MAGQRPGEYKRAGFVGVFGQEHGEGFGADFGQEGGSGLAALRVYAHVERAFVFQRKATGGVVELHRGDAEVGKDEVSAGEALGAEDLGEAGEVAAVGCEGGRAETEGAQASFGLR